MKKCILTISTFFALMTQLQAIEEEILLPTPSENLPLTSLPNRNKTFGFASYIGIYGLFPFVGGGTSFRAQTSAFDACIAASPLDSKAIIFSFTASRVYYQTPEARSSFYWSYGGGVIGAFHIPGVHFPFRFGKEGKTSFWDVGLAPGAALLIWEGVLPFVNLEIRGGLSF